jgi:hypothetical protein
MQVTVNNTLIVTAALTTVCRFPEDSIPPKFHVITYEHSRLLKLYQMCGMTTEEAIEALHREENSYLNRSSHIKDMEKRLLAMCESQQDRYGTATVIQVKKRKETIEI